MLKPVRSAVLFARRRVGRLRSIAGSSNEPIQRFDPHVKLRSGHSLPYSPLSDLAIGSIAILCWDCACGYRQSLGRCRWLLLLPWIARYESCHPGAFPFVGKIVRQNTFRRLRPMQSEVERDLNRSPSPYRRRRTKDEHPPFNPVGARYRNALAPRRPHRQVPRRRPKRCAYR